MSLFQYLPFLMIIVIVMLIISSIFAKKKSLPVKLFIEAQKNENDGHFEEAVVTYNFALDEVKKIRFHGSLKNRIIGKLKVLHTAIEYKENLHFGR